MQQPAAHARAGLAAGVLVVQGASQLAAVASARLVMLGIGAAGGAAGAAGSSTVAPARAALHLPGAAGAAVLLPDHAVADALQSGAFSVSLWLCPDQLPPEGCILLALEPALPGHGLEVLYRSGSLVLRHYGNSATAKPSLLARATHAAPPPISALSGCHLRRGTWTHLALVMRRGGPLRLGGDVASLCVDGLPTSTAACRYALAKGAACAKVRCVLGSSVAAYVAATNAATRGQPLAANAELRSTGGMAMQSATPGAFEGQLGGFAMLRGALSEAEVAALFDAGPAGLELVERLARAEKRGLLAAQLGARPAAVVGAWSPALLALGNGGSDGYADGAVARRDGVALWHMPASLPPLAPLEGAARERALCALTAAPPARVLVLRPLCELGLSVAFFLLPLERLVGEVTTPPHPCVSFSLRLLSQPQ
ncbi:hypothetical protein T492DRAFT_1149910 [Pavlovales sp. CCMP2436]|nr:hypothetical protein T492DRAFT_1149910 [Pavlovales sp. CCMP2436]